MAKKHKVQEQDEPHANEEQRPKHHKHIGLMGLSNLTMTSEIDEEEPEIQLEANAGKAPTGNNKNRKKETSRVVKKGPQGKKIKSILKTTHRTTNSIEPSERLLLHLGGESAKRVNTLKNITSQSAQPSQDEPSQEQHHVEEEVNKEEQVDTRQERRQSSKIVEEMNVLQEIETRAKEAQRRSRSQSRNREPKKTKQPINKRSRSRSQDRKKVTNVKKTKIAKHKAPKEKPQKTENVSQDINLSMEQIKNLNDLLKENLELQKVAFTRQVPEKESSSEDDISSAIIKALKAVGTKSFFRRIADWVEANIDEETAQEVRDEFHVEQPSWKQKQYQENTPSPQKNKAEPRSRSSSKRYSEDRRFTLLEEPIENYSDGEEEVQEELEPIPSPSASNHDEDEAEGAHQEGSQPISQEGDEENEDNQMSQENDNAETEEPLEHVSSVSHEEAHGSIGGFQRESFNNIPVPEDDHIEDVFEEFERAGSNEINNLDDPMEDENREDAWSNKEIDSNSGTKQREMMSQSGDEGSLNGDSNKIELNDLMNSDNNSMEDHTNERRVHSESNALFSQKIDDEVIEKLPEPENENQDEMVAEDSHHAHSAPFTHEMEPEEDQSNDDSDKQFRDNEGNAEQQRHPINSQEEEMAQEITEERLADIASDIQDRLVIPEVNRNTTSRSVTSEDGDFPIIGNIPEEEDFAEKPNHHMPPMVEIPQEIVPTQAVEVPLSRASNMPVNNDTEKAIIFEEEEEAELRLSFDDMLRKQYPDTPTEQIPQPEHTLDLGHRAKSMTNNADGESSNDEKKVGLSDHGVLLEPLDVGTYGQHTLQETDHDDHMFKYSEKDKSDNKRDSGRIDPAEEEERAPIEDDEDGEDNNTSEGVLFGVGGTQGDSFRKDSQGNNESNFEFY